MRVTAAVRKIIIYVFIDFIGSRDENIRSLLKMFIMQYYLLLLNAKYFKIELMNQQYI